MNGESMDKAKTDIFFSEITINNVKYYLLLFLFSSLAFLVPLVFMDSQLSRTLLEGLQSIALLVIFLGFVSKGNKNTSPVKEVLRKPIKYLNVIVALISLAIGFMLSYTLGYSTIILFKELLRINAGMAVEYFLFTGSATVWFAYLIIITQVAKKKVLNNEDLSKECKTEIADSNIDNKETDNLQSDSCRVNRKVSFCRKCGKELNADSKFCDNCGTKVIKG